MADQDKPQDQQAAAQTVKQKPTATGSAPAPEPATEPAAANAIDFAQTHAAAAAAPEPAASAAGEKSAEPAAAPTGDKKEDEGKGEKEDSKPEYFKKTPALAQLFDRLPGVLKSAGHEEMWGVPLKHDAADVPTVNVLIKYLRANEGNVKAAEEQLVKALQWRKEFDPLALVDAAKTSFDAEKFGGLGYLTAYEREGKGDLIVTWNIYGAVKKIDATFGDITE